MNRHSPVRFAFFCVSMLSATAFADVVVLNSGEKLEGKITQETDKEITIAAKVTASITDERVVKKSDIKTITKDAPDEIAWQSLKGAKLGKNSLPLASYDAVLNPLNGFVREFPQSKFAADAKKIADAFEAEKKRVEAGEVKLEDKWLSKEEAQKERLQINGLIAFNYMKDQSTRDMSAALNTLDAIEKNFSATRAYPDAVEYAQRMLPALKAEVERRQKALATQKTEQAEALKKLTGPEKAAMEAEYKTAKTNAEAAVTAAEKLGLKWLPLNPATERSLSNLNTKVSSETSRLAAVPVAKMRASIQAAEKARTLLAANDVPAAEAALAQASTDWANNELVTRLRPELDEAKKVAAAAVAAAAAAKAAPVAVTDAEVLPPAPTEKAPKAAAPVAEEVGSERPFLLTPGGAIVVVILVGLLFAAYTAFKKIKAKAGEIIE